MSTKIVVGNLLEDAAVTMVPAAEATLPSEHLFDGPGQLGARFGAVGSDPYVQIDLSTVEFWDGATGVDPSFYIATDDPGVAITDIIPDTDWTVRPTSGTGSSYLRSITDAGAGSADHGGNDRSLNLATDADAAMAVLPYTLRAGARYKMEAWAQKLVSNNGFVIVRLYCRATRRWLDNTGAWASSASDLVFAGTYDSGATWFGINSGAGIEFQAPTAAEVMANEVDLELQLHEVRTGGSGPQGRFDDIAIYPAVDIMAVANGHNIRAAHQPKWKTSDDGLTFSTTEATFTVERHQFCAVLDAPIYKRYHRLQMDDTLASQSPTEKVYLSELVLGATQALEREPQEPLQMDYIEAGQVRLETAGGSTGISNKGPYPLRRVSMRFRFATAAEEAAVRAVLVDNVRGGARSILVLPAGDFGTFLYGDLEAGLSVSHSMLSARQPDVSKREYYSDATFNVREGAGFEIL